MAEFEVRSHTFDGFTLPYRLFIPEGYDGSRPHPLIVTFHGSGERGNNNTSQIAVHRIATAWADTQVQSRHQLFVVSPQVPSGGRWEDVVISPTGTAPIRREMATVLDLLDSLSSEFSIDPDRVYATGLSLGGYGTFDAVSRDPSRFAAALAMSGGYAPHLANSIGNVPLWIIHGEEDGTVPPVLSKNMVTMFEALGRDAFYTHCDYFRCNLKSDEQIEKGLAARPDLVFMGVANVGHGPWAPWYDDPRIQEWLLGKHRLTPGLLTVTSPAEGDRLDGTLSLEWEGGGATDSIEVMYRNNPARDWERLLGPVPNSGVLDIDTALLPDTPFGQFEIVLVGADGLPLAREKSPFVLIDNTGDSAPVVELPDLGFRVPTSITIESTNLLFRAGDAETSSLSAALSYSVDAGLTFDVFEQFEIASSPDLTLHPLDLAALPNSDDAVIRIEVSDGSSVSFDSSPVFSKATPRLTSSFVEQVTGMSTAGITISFVDSSKLTGHRYRVTIDVPDGLPKTYSVYDLDLEVPVPVLFDVPITGSEGPEFDGIRLTVSDLETAEPDRDRTGWTVGDVTMGVSVRAPRVTLAGEQIESLGTPADYRITVFEETVDTTSSLFEFEPLPIRFTTENITAGARRKVLFDDVDANGLPSHGERLYILEEGSDNRLLPAWMLTFVRGAPDVGPDTGDVFELITLKPATADDVFEFVGMIGVDIESETLPPAELILHQNYPNPFSDRTDMRYTLNRPATVTLSVYDALGRVITVFNRGVEARGDHTLVFDRKLAAGVYFYRLTAEDGEGGTHTLTNRMLVVR